MAANPLVDQGTLNRIRGAINFPQDATLNVTASYLGKDGISLALEGDATTTIPTMTGTAQSPEPYQMCTITIHLLKTQNLANIYKAQMEASTLVGPATVYPDSAALGNYTIQNCAIKSVREMPMNGTDAGYVVTVTGYYVINNDLWNL